MAESAPLEQWVAELEAAIGAAGVTDARAVLALVRDVAHGFDRPAGPLSAYLAGVAVGRGTHTFEQVSAVVEQMLDVRRSAQERGDELQEGVGHSEGADT